jgi:CubicO group peptidase (beta-lactamase class C family)
MTSRQRTGLKDNSFGQVIDWGLGFLINSARYGAAAIPYGYGRHASDGTFGHGGMQSSSGFADPENKLAVAIIFNGLPGEPKHQKRIHDAATALYEDLGLN